MCSMRDEERHRERKVIFINSPLKNIKKYVWLQKRICRRPDIFDFYLENALFSRHRKCHLRHLVTALFSLEIRRLQENILAMRHTTTQICPQTICLNIFNTRFYGFVVFILAICCVAYISISLCFWALFFFCRSICVCICACLYI